MDQAQAFFSIAQLFVLCVVFIATYFFITEKFSQEVISICATAALVVHLAILYPKKFSTADFIFNDAVIAIMGLLMIAGVLCSTSIVNGFANLLVRTQRKAVTPILLFAIYFFSGFINNTPIVVVLVSLLGTVASNKFLQQKKILMPIAFAASLGAMLTVLGSSTNIIIQSKLKEFGYNIGVFDFFIPGLFISSIGMIYVIFMTKIIKPSNNNGDDIKSEMFYVKLKNPEQKSISENFDLTFEQAKNILHKVNIRQNLVLKKAVIKDKIYDLKNGIKEWLFSHLKILGIIAKQNDQEIQGGEVFIVQKASDAKQSTKEIIECTNWLHILSKSNTVKVILVFLGVILCSALYIFLISVCVFLGVSAIIALGITTAKHAFSFLDIKIFSVIIYAFTFSKSMELTGILHIITEFLYKELHGLSVITISGVLFVIIMLLNEVISNNAVGLIFTPIIIEFSQKAGIDPKILVWTLVFAANAAFLTPFGYQTNLIVMHKGGYRFIDYIKFGLPLSLIVLCAHLFFITIFLKLF